jgi:hypothetical protein
LGWSNDFYFEVGYSILGEIRMNSLLIVLLLSTIGAHANDSATVILVRGTATTDQGKTLQLKDVVPSGSTIKTGPRSFVKLLLSDQSQLSVGPESEMKIEPKKAGDPALINLVGGQIRAKVTKDLMNKNQGDPKEKLLIKTKTAAMGVRGTDFNVTFNQMNSFTALITFEGSVAMARMDSPGLDPMIALRASEGVQSVGAGQFSGAQPDMAQASVPVKISPSQLATLQSNDQFQGVGEQPQQKANAMASPIPPGVDPKSFSSDAAKIVAASLNEAIGTSSSESSASRSAGPPPEGFFNAKTGEYAPRAGGFVDLNSGRYVPPPPGSSFDANTGVFVPPAAMGTVDPSTGMYVPPKGVDLDPVKGFVPEAPRNPASTNAPGASSSAGPSASANSSAATAPSSPAGAAAPATAAANSQGAAMASAMQTISQPQMAGRTAEFNPVFTPTAEGGRSPASAPTFNLPPPPAPGAPTTPVAAPPPPPPPRFEAPPPPPPCVDCFYQNVPAAPPNTPVQFNISVGS